MERRLEIAPFGGLVTSVDESVIGSNSASDLLNVRIGDGRLRTRLGHSQIAVALSGATVLGSEHVKGYDNSYLYKEEILQILSVSGVRKPYGVNPTTGTRTEILDGITPLALSSGDWSALSFNGEALAYKRGGPVYRHAIGDATSWKALDVSPPSSLTGATSVSFEITEDLSSNTSAGNIDWSTVTGAEFDTTDLTTFTGVSGTSFDVAPNATAIQTFTMELPGGPLDYTAIEDGSLSIIITGGVRGTGFTNLDIAFLDASDNVLDLDVSFTLSGGLTSKTATVTFSVPPGFDLSGFDDVDRIRITFSAIAYVVFGGNYYYPTPSPNVRIGEVTLTTSDPMGSGAPTISGTPERMRFGVAPFDSETAQESADVLASVWFEVDSGPIRFFSDSGTYLGNKPTITLPTPATPANQMRAYVMFESENLWRLIESSEEAEVEVGLTVAQLKLLPERVVLVRDPVGDVLTGCAHAGFVAWGVAGGKSNLKLSGVGDPGRLANKLDYLEDDTRGSNLTLSDNFSSGVVGMASSDVSLYIGGTDGLYVMTGTTPSSMTPPKRVPGSSGLIGPRAITKARDDAGNPGCAYIDTSGRLWLVQVLSTNSEFGLRLNPIDIKIQGHIDSWLFGGSSPTAEQVSLVADFESDSLWLQYGTKALVLRRASLATGEREWEPYSYAATWVRLCEDDKNAPIAIGSASSVHRLDSGTTDAGGAIPTPYWESREFSDVNRSLHRVEVEREPMSSTPSVTVTSDRGTTTKALGANLRHAKFHIAVQQGWRHKVKIALSAVTTVVNRIVVTERVPSGKGLDR